VLAFGLDSEILGMTRSTLDITAVQAALRQFAAERDWEQFHSPKNLAAALAVEAAELLEIFQWLTEAQSLRLEAAARAAAAEEIADVQIYLLRLADRLNIDVPTAVAAKMARNAVRYPASEVRGSARKADKLRGEETSG
jgi:NTP pyrophosphatase (non-canonical NTP hydrolase)